MCIFIYIIFMSGKLNYEKDTRDPELRQWNRALNYTDIVHDVSTDIKTNRLFTTLLSNMFPEHPVIPRYKKDYEPYSVYTNNILCYPLPNNAMTIRPAQLKNKYGISDNCKSSKFSMIEKITPSYYFDSAGREFEDKRDGIFGEMETFCHINGIIKREIDLSKYDVNYKMIIDFTDHNNEKCLEITLKYIPGLKHKLDLTAVVNPTGYQVHGKPLFLIDEFPYETEKKKEKKIKKIYYLGGNTEKEFFFRKNEDIHNNTNNGSGIRMIICKLLGDLSHLVFSCDNDIVVTTDSYLRERCIKNKVAVICRDTVEKTTVPRDCIVHADDDDDDGNKKSKKGKKGEERVKVYYYIPIQSDLFLSECLAGGTNNMPSNGQKDKKNGGTTSEYNLFANGSNKENVKNYIDNYVDNLKNFLKNPVFVNKYKCADEAMNYIDKLITFLNGKVKSEIDKIATYQSIDDFNSKIMRWFPLDMIVETHDVIRETPSYFIPTKITKIFPELGDTIDGFDNKIPFKKLAIEEIKIENNHSLKDILKYLSKNLNELRESDEVIECQEIIENLNKKDKIIPEDLFTLLDICVDNEFIHEDNILFEYLLFICDYNIIDAYTYCTVLMQLTYITGYYIYNYNIIKAFAEKIRTTNYIFTDGFIGFKSFMLKNMKSQKNEEDINAKISPEKTKLDKQNKTKKTIFSEFYRNTNKPRTPQGSIAAGKPIRKNITRKLSRTLSRKKKY